MTLGLATYPERLGEWSKSRVACDALAAAHGQSRKLRYVDKTLVVTRLLGEMFDVGVNRFCACRGARSAQLDAPASLCCIARLKSRSGLQAFHKLRPLLVRVLVSLMSTIALCCGSSHARYDPIAEQVSAGDSFTCAVLTGGTVQCWGSGGQPAFSDAPQRVADLTDAVAVTAGTWHACALRKLGTVACWGNNGYGQLGNGSREHSAKPVPVAGVAGAVAIASSNWGTCALLISGSVVCWGEDGSGCCTAPVAATKFANVNDAVAIFGGEVRGCVVDRAGALKCWGRDRSAGAILALANVAISSVSSGVAHTCAVATNGSMYCWGTNSSGQLGDGTNVDRSSPVQVSVPGGARSVSVGEFHTCAVSLSAAVYCWGANADGQLGVGSNAGSRVPVPVASLVDTALISAGRKHTCALSATGRVQCWGDNRGFGLGTGRLANVTLPAPVLPWSGAEAPILTGVVSGSAATSHTCARSTSGTVQCWGSTHGSYGPSISLSPVAADIVGLSGVVAVAAGGINSSPAENGHTCAILGNATVACFGYNGNGQLGDGTTQDAKAPVAVAGLVGAKRLSLGGSHSCVVNTSGNVYCWGLNQRGQLANGDLKNSATPAAVLGLPLISEVAAGGFHTCALGSTGTVHCWGWNGYGQLGNATVQDSAVPVPVSSLGGVVALSAGGLLTCALDISGNVWCWGASQGSGSFATPQQVAGINGEAVQISASDAGGCAALRSGAVKCWGSSLYSSPSGASNSSTTITAAAVNGLSYVASVAAASYFSCSFLKDGTARCWGNNSVGQLGNPNYFDPVEPVPVLAVAGSSAAGENRPQNLDLPPWLTGGTATLKVGDAVFLTGTSTSGLPVTFDTWTPETCRITNGQVVALKRTLCGIRASQQGGVSDGVTYAPALSKAAVIDISGESSATSITATPNPSIYGQRVDIVATLRATSGKSPGGVVNFYCAADAVIGAAVCGNGSMPVCVDVAIATVDGRAQASCALLYLGAGAGSLFAVYSGDGVYDGSRSTAAELVIAKATQSLQFGAVPSLTVGGSTALFIVRSLRNSGNPVIIISLTASVCTVSGGIVTGVSSGECRLTASQAGDANFLAAPQISLTFTVEPAGTKRAMIEYVYAPLNYYFQTSRVSDQLALDGASGWARTGQSFLVFAGNETAAVPVTRFYFDQIARNGSRGSHFYTLIADEVYVVQSLNWQNERLPGKPFNEGVDAYAFMPSADGTCSAGLLPVHRLFRNAVKFPDDPNHRFTTSLSIYNDHIRLGWDGEGVKLCVPAQ